MKTMKKALSLILAALLLSALALPAAAETTLIEKADLYYTRPTIGAKAGSLTPISGDPDQYDVCVDYIYYFCKDANGNLIQNHGNYEIVTLKADDTFVEGENYRVRFEFIPKSGYRFDKMKTTFLINSVQAKTFVAEKSNIGAVTFEVGFTPKQAEAENTAKTGSCPYCHEDHNGFLGFLTAFFHKILYRLLGEKK